MSDYGDFCREQRHFKQAQRRHWHECPSPGCQFGGNPVKVAPGASCRHCGWVAPGGRGDDVRAARQEIARAEQPKKPKGPHRCGQYNKRFNSLRGVEDHTRDVHKAATP